MPDIDLMLTLHPHRWSTCLLQVNGTKIEMVISHVFGDPLYDFVNVLKRLLEGSVSVSFTWYGEPGGYAWEIDRIKNQQNVKMKIEDFKESFGDRILNKEILVELEVELSQLLIVSYYQLRKLSELLKVKSYSINRNGQFPFREFENCKG